MVVGAFGIKYNAELVEIEARKKGLDTLICSFDGKYCVEAGCFTDSEQAKDCLAMVKQTGYVFAYIVTKSEHNP